MKSVRKLSRPFIFVVLLLTLILSGSLNRLSTNQEILHDHTFSASTMKYISYYSDASLTTQVGLRIIRCNGTFTTTGQVTQFTLVETEPCCGRIPC